MEPFRIHKGLVAPLGRPNIDTDQIIPKQFLKRVERTGFGQFLFYDWRYRTNGELNEDFILNQPAYKEATILVAGRNFGCGSSREHAPWALLDYGFRAIIAPSFADIFATNCLKNGILPVAIAEQDVATLLERAQKIPNYSVTVDLEKRLVTDVANLCAGFGISDFHRHCLLEGLDEIGLSLYHEPHISAYEQQRQAWRVSVN